MAFLVPAGGFTQALEETSKQLAGLGAVQAGDDRGDTIRRVSFLVNAPGWGAVTTTVFDYREEYQRTDQGWLRTRYVFEYRTIDPRSRRAHHRHGVWDIHQHCEPPGRPSGEHYTDVERLLQATHEAFARVYELSAPIVCSGLRIKPGPRHPTKEDE